MNLKKIEFILLFILMVPSITATTCNSGEQMFDNNCYVCNGYLQFNPDNRGISCINCKEGFNLTNKQIVQKERFDYVSSGTCTILPSSQWNPTLNQKIDKIAERISSLFHTDILVGFFVLLVLFVAFIYYLLKLNKFI